VLIAELMDSQFRGVHLCCRACAEHPKCAALSAGRRNAQHQTRYHAQQLSSAGPHASEYTGVRPRAIAGYVVVWTGLFALTQLAHIPFACSREWPAPSDAGSTFSSF
jgi:hypothetical protein